MRISRFDPLLPVALWRSGRSRTSLNEQEARVSRSFPIEQRAAFELMIDRRIPTAYNSLGIDNCWAGEEIRSLRTLWLLTSGAPRQLPNPFVIHERPMSESSGLRLGSMRAHCSEPEWQTRVDLAACYRLVELYGMSDMLANHISARVPGQPDAFLINAYGMLYEEITASSLIKVDYDGKILNTPDFGSLAYSVNQAGYVIHSAVHAARPDVDCVIHVHTWASMAVSSLECGLLPITQTAMRFLKIGYHDYRGVVLNIDERKSLIRDLGSAEALILRNHGALVVGRTIGEAFNWTHRLELACRAQLAAMACNAKFVAVSQSVLEETWSNYQPRTRRAYGVMEWHALLRRLDKIDPSYRD